MKLKVLVDNNTCIDHYYVGEPAVSYYIESGDIRLLFDMGYSDIFMKNAEAMGIDLSAITHMVCSHGHNDHINGLKYLSERVDLSNVELIAHPSCFSRKKLEDTMIGAPFSGAELTRICRYLPQTKPYAISEEWMYLGQIPTVHEFEKRKAIGQYEDEDGWHEDYVMDDSALVYKNQQGLFIITGCSHSGICNIIEYAMEICGSKRILGVIGGFHLFAVDERLERTIAYMKQQNIEHFYPCHCVSLKAKAKMMEKLRVREVGVGLELNI